MTAAVRYYTRSGNTKKVADAIAKTVGCEAEQIPAPIDEPVDILFLGASVYWGGIASEVKDYIRSLDPSKIGKVVVFSTSALAERAFPQMEACLKEAGIPVEKENFYCRGQFTALHRGRPNQEDLKNAGEFGQKIMEQKS